MLPRKITQEITLNTKVSKTCGRHQLESVFSHLGPINNLTVHDGENVTIHTDDGRFPAITELKNTFPWSHKPTKWTLSSASQNFKTSHPVSLKDPF